MNIQKIQRPPMHLRVHDLPENISAKDVREMFSNCGRVADVRIHSDNGGETFAFFSLLNPVADLEPSNWVRWHGKTFSVEEGWDYEG